MTFTLAIICAGASAVLTIAAGILEDCRRVQTALAVERVAWGSLCVAALLLFLGLLLKPVA